jgi:MFS family permease
MVVLVLASAGGGLAPGLGVLIVARFAQGAAAVAIMPAHQLPGRRHTRESTSNSPICSRRSGTIPGKYARYIQAYLRPVLAGQAVAATCDGVEPKASPNLGKRKHR